MCKNVTAIVCAARAHACVMCVCAPARAHFKCHLPMLYRSNEQLNEAETEWMAGVWGNTRGASAASHPSSSPGVTHASARVIKTQN